MKLAEKKKTKKENEKRKMHQQSKLAWGAQRDGMHSCEGHSNVACVVMRAQWHGEVARNGKAQGILSSPRVTVVIMLLLSVMGPWWALEGEGVSIGKDADRTWWLGWKRGSQQRETKRKCISRLAESELARSAEATGLGNLAKKKDWTGDK
jgi:hypothetical protein